MPNEPIFLQNLVTNIREAGKERTISKGGFIIKEGEVEQHVYYIESGAVRVFLLSEFEELTIRFGYEGSIINSLASFVRGTPSEFYIEAIRKTTLRAISKQDFKAIVNSGPERMMQYNSMLEVLVTQQIEREIDLLTVSPSERLRRVLDRSPNLFQQIPLKYIASYLRMTPETLSRIRNS